MIQISQILSLIGIGADINTERLDIALESLQVKKQKYILKITCYVTQRVTLLV